MAAVLSPRQLRDLPWPMALTVLRLLLVPVFLVLLILAAPGSRDSDKLRYVALSVFAVMAITDTLDGYLARKLNQVSKLGTFLDPIADKLLVSATLLVLVFPRFAPAGFAIPWPVLWGIYQKDLCVVIGALVVKRELGKVEINANRAGKINTLVELAMVIATLLAPEWIAISPNFAAIFLWSLWHLTVLATAWAAFGYSIEGSRQLRAAANARENRDLPTSPVSPA
jgi:CDP-diacylglycerol--glycerol-3-phosphate 3-phosphatidyltransferase